MNFVAMLENMAWEPSNLRNDIEKVDRILTSLRNSLYNDKNMARIKKTYHEFWECVATNNLFICVTVLKRAEKIMAFNDECITEGFSVVNEEISRFNIEDEYDAAWRLLSELVLKTNNHIIDYSRYFLNIGKLKNVLKRLEITQDFDSCVGFYLNSTCISDVDFRRGAINDIMSLNWSLDASQINDKTVITEIIDNYVRWNDIYSLFCITTLFDNIQISAYCNNTLDEWENYLVNLKLPMAMVLYQTILRNEKIDINVRLNRLRDFALLSVKNTNVSIYAYMFLSYAILEEPAQYDEHIRTFKSILMNVGGLIGYEALKLTEVEKNDDATLQTIDRKMNCLLVDEPFLALIKNNPTQVKDFIETIGEISLYHISQSLTYKRSKTWSENTYRPEYKCFITEFSKTHNKSEVVKLYMNSPLKSTLDFSYVIRLLYQPKEGWVDLSSVLDDYVFRGKLIRTTSDDKNISYRVTMSNAYTSYTFPIHHSWIKYQKEELDTKFSENESLYFKIMSVNSKGMIFAYELSPKPKQKKVKNNENVQSVVLKNLEQFFDDSIPLQGNNQPEDIRLYVTVMLSNENGNILIRSENKNNKIIESLPYLPVSNCESSDYTLKRFLKYFLGIHKYNLHTPCGIRHICSGRDKRAVFILYKICATDLSEKILDSALRKSMCWRDYSEFSDNVNDKISLSFLRGFNIPWSEESLFL